MLIPPERFELPTPWVVARCSRPLSYGGSWCSVFRAPGAGRVERRGRAGGGTSCTRPGRLELPPFRSTAGCSHRLSYSPNVVHRRRGDGDGGSEQWESRFLLLERAPRRPTGTTVLRYCVLLSPDHHLSNSVVCESAENRTPRLRSAGGACRTLPECRAMATLTASSIDARTLHRSFVRAAPARTAAAARSCSVLRAYASDLGRRT